MGMERDAKDQASPKANDDAIFARHAPKDLPEWCTKLLDPSLPVPADVVHIERDYSPNPAMTGFTAIPAAFAVIMTVIDGVKGKLILHEWLALFPIFTAPLLIALYLNRRAVALRTQIAEGRLRMGLFLTEDALLLRTSPNTCSMIPRKCIAQFEKTVQSPGRASMPSTYRIRVYYNVMESGESVQRHVEFNCPDLQGHLFGEEKLLHLLQTWANQPVAAIREHLTQFCAERGKRRGPLTPNEISRAKREAWEAEEKIRIEQKKIDDAKIPKPRKIAPTLDASGMPKSYWESLSDDDNYYLQLTARGEVAAWENWRHNSHSESGGSVTFEQFLAGEYQSLAQASFGMAGLEEIIASVDYLVAHPELLKKLQ
ncbi:hypothetical protein BH11PSE11_BH11PSE11_36350 [soil metagenome]